MQRIRWWVSMTEDSDLSVRDLLSRTARYWNLDGRDEKERLKHYVKNLLPYELHFADERLSDVLVEIDHHVSAHDGVERSLHGKGRCG